MRLQYPVYPQSITSTADDLDLTELIEGLK
jgi:hypothetical protein